MRPEGPRLEPLPESEWTDEVRERLAKSVASRGSRPANVFTTLAHHPKLLKRWTVFANHVLFKSSLPARERELVILRIAWLARSEYEFGQHTRIGQEAGLSLEEIGRITAGTEAAEWDEGDRAVLRAVDELFRDTCLSDETWQSLNERWDTQQVLDLIFATGGYLMLAMALNSLGVERDEGVVGFPDDGGAAG